MTKTFTENDLLGFLYGDLTKKQESEIQQALLTDHTLLQKFKALKETKDELSKVMVKAPQSRRLKHQYFKAKISFKVLIQA